MTFSRDVDIENLSRTSIKSHTTRVFLAFERLDLKHCISKHNLEKSCTVYTLQEMGKKDDLLFSLSNCSNSKCGFFSRQLEENLIINLALYCGGHN